MSRRRPPAPASTEDGEVAAAGRLRIDRWLWHVRACKTRALAVAQISGGGVRVNGQPCRKPGRLVGPGDVVTFALGRRVLVYEVLAAGSRRGPAAEAATLYRDLTPASDPDLAAP